MKKVLSILILLSAISINVKAQRNSFRVAGFAYDNCLTTEGSSRAELVIFSNCGIIFGYERTFGQHLSLGINYTLPYVLLFSKRTLEEEGLYYEPNNSVTYRSNQYSEYQRWGLSYNSKFFFTPFDEEAEGAYIAPTLGYNSYVVRMLDNTMDDHNGSGYPKQLNDVEETYGTWRYGIKLGVQYGGDLYIGYFFNSVPDKNGNLPFSTPISVNSTNFIIGYVWGFNL